MFSFNSSTFRLLLQYVWCTYDAVADVIIFLACMNCWTLNQLYKQSNSPRWLLETGAAIRENIAFSLEQIYR